MGRIMDASTAWKRLNEVYMPKPKPSEEMFDQFKKAIQRYNPLAIKNANDHTVENEQRFPTIALFRAYVETFQERIDAELRAKQKQEERKVSFGRDETAKTVMECVKGLMRGKLTRREYIDRLQAVGVDCGLTGWYEKMGYDLDDKCRMSKIGSRIVLEK